METVVSADLKSQSSCIKKSYTLLSKKEISFVNNKFYQKLFVVLISMSTFLIFSESPRELENICHSYISSKLCNVW